MYKLPYLVSALLLLVIGCARESEPSIALPPAAGFAASPVQGQAPLTVAFADLSTGDINRWHWDFGDGQFSSLPEPSHTYTTPGNYTVSLAVMGPGGSHLKTKVDYIKVSLDVISWEEAGSYIGQHKLVEGIIVGTHYAADTKSKPTYLDFHKPYEGYFKCVIWGYDRDKFIKEFPPNPEIYFLNKRVQVTGLIQEYPKGSGAPEVILKDSSQIKVIGE